MKVRLTLAGLALSALAAVPASAQLAGFPVTPVPAMGDAPQSSISGMYGRGLNQGSGEENAFGVGYARTGAPVSFTIGAGFWGDDNDVTLGGQVGFTVLNHQSFDLGIQGGLGWTSPGPFTWIHIPVGASFTFTTSEVGDGAALTPWVMPRFSIRRFSYDDANVDADTEFDPGVSGGVGLALEGGFGIMAALDYLLQDGDDALTLGIGVSYAFPGGN